MYSKTTTPRNWAISAFGIILFIFFQQTSLGQLLQEVTPTDGITISHSDLHFNVKPGKSQTKTVKVTNLTDNTQILNVVYQDFDINKDGESRFMEAGSNEFSLAELIVVSSGSLELEPNTTEEITLTVSLPQDYESEKAAWGVLMIENGDEITSDEANSTEEMPQAYTFATGVWLFQNPDEAENSHVDITNFIFANKVKNNTLFLKVKNKGDGISFCNAYVKITNLATGEMSQLGGSTHSILPGNRRTFVFDLSENLPRGRYSAVGVVDYNTDKELVATELQFKVD